MKKIIFSLLLLSTLLYSCNEDNDNNPTPTPTPSTYYIEGKVNGVMHRAEYICPDAGCVSATGNYNEFMQRITMSRTTSATDNIGWYISINDINSLDAWQLPAAYDASQSLDLYYYKGPWTSDNLYDVDGAVLGDNSFTMNVTSKAGDVLEGTFSGQLVNGTYTDSTVTVTEGKFKIHLVRM